MRATVRIATTMCRATAPPTAFVHSQSLASSRPPLLVACVPASLQLRRIRAPSLAPSLWRQRAQHVWAAARVEGKRGGTGVSDDTPDEGKRAARAVRAVPVRVLCVAKAGSQPLEAIAAEWGAKVARYSPFTETLLRPNPKNSRDPAEQRASEAERVLKNVQPNERLVMLDERGREVSSDELANLIAGAGDRGDAALVFAIGGPFGHGDAVRARADDTIRLSKMVLNHQIARLVLLEQIYRAWTILRGEPYHH